MEASIQWEIDYGVALKKAQADKKPILLDFFNPG
jgi:hypothetical protein